MIAFGSAITKPDVYAACAEPGIRRASEPDSVILSGPSLGGLIESYNALIDQAAQLPDLEALVLVHQDAEIMDDDFPHKVREVLKDPDVGLIGCVGAIGVRSIAWWEGSVTQASFTHRYKEHGGGELPAFSWVWDHAPPFARIGEVETLDGFLLVLSPWTVQNIRFDMDLGNLHGYDLDFCLQVREAKKKVVTADFRAVHNHSLTLVSDPENWIDAHMKVAEKWDGRMPHMSRSMGTWKERALRAEGDREIARSVGYSNAIDSDAQVRELQRQIEITRQSLSWKITSPLRIANRVAKVASGLRGGASSNGNGAHG